MVVDTEGKEQSQGKIYVQCIAAIVATTTLLTHGMQAGWIATTINLLQSEDSPSGRPLTDNEISLIAAAIPLAASPGVILFAVIVDTLGRKKAIIIMAAMQSLCWILNIISSDLTSILVGRVFAGLAGGGCFNVIPMYVREISQDNIRGTLGSIFVLMQNLGYLLMFATGYYMNYYRVFWIIVWFPLVNIVLMLLCPESPPFLVKIGEVDKSASTLVALRGLDVNNKIIQKELEYMQNQDNTFKSLARVSFSSIWQNKIWRRVCFLNFAIMACRNFSGNYVLLTFTPNILAASGVIVQPELQTLIFPIVIMLASIVSISCADKFGRKFILMTTSFLGGVALAVLATVILLQHRESSPPGWVAVVSIVVYFIAFGAGISPMPYIILAETFNFHIRTKIIGAVVACMWLGSFVQMLSYMAVTKLIGEHNVFYIFAACNLLGAIICLFFLPETKGKTVEEIEMALKDK